LPFPFTGQSAGSAFILRPASLSAQNSTIDCNTSAPAVLTVLQRVIMVPPTELTSGMTWSDSSSVSTCSGPIMVSLTTIRSYTVLGETEDRGMKLIAINRVERTHSSGEGSQSQHRMIIKATGTGSGILRLDQHSGLLVNAETQYRADVEVTSSGRVQRFTQVVRERTALVR